MRPSAEIRVLRVISVEAFICYQAFLYAVSVCFSHFIRLQFVFGL